MIGRSLVLVFAAFSLVAGSCVEVITPQRCSRVVTVPLPKLCLNHHRVSDCDSRFSNDDEEDSMSGSVTLPIVAERVVSEPVCTRPVEDVFSSTFTPVTGSALSLGEFVKTSETFEPETAPLPVVQAPPVTLPTIESPLITLCSPVVPPPRVLSSRCVCTKTVVKPQIIQRVVTVPRIHRFLKRTVTPVVENVVYKARPVSSNFESSSSGPSVVVSGPSNGGSNSFVLSSSSSSPSVMVPETSCSRIC